MSNIDFQRQSRYSARMDPLADLMRATATRLGISPIDLATAISYETAGTFDPNIAGPTTKYGQHRGLIQFGEPQAAQYGVADDWSEPNQMRAVGDYLTDAGVQPGMGLLDVYLAINAGHVGRYGASDAAAGGAPGTVRDKVEDQMSGHVLNAQNLLGGTSAQASAQPMQPQTQAPAVPSQSTPSPFELAMQMPVDYTSLSGQGTSGPPSAGLPTENPNSVYNNPQPEIPLDFSPKRKVSDYRAPDLDLLSTSVRPLKLRA